jgi:hypothetical protein
MVFEVADEKPVLAGKDAVIVWVPKVRLFVEKSAELFSIVAVPIETPESANVIVPAAPFDTAVEKVTVTP